jgi:hypothetical protein
LFFLPLACFYDLFRASSAWVKGKAVLLAVGGALLYLIFYQPALLVNAGAMDWYTAQMIAVVRQLLTPKIESTLLGLVWALLLPANVILAVTGTRIREFVNGKKWGTVLYWILTVYFAGEAFQQSGGWSLVLLSIPSLTTVFAWIEQMVHRIL